MPFLGRKECYRLKLDVVYKEEEEEKEKLKENNSQDEDYFKSYADVSIHENMLSDAVRTNAYRCAILKNYEKIRGKVVVDVGAGTGILSIFCVQAGAKKVYAIEASDMAEQTKLIVAENNMSERITVIKGKVEEVDLPEEVDIIISEWMGYSLLYESMLQSVLNARDRWLKKDGLIFPYSAVLYIAPFCDEDIDERLQIWSDIKSKYKVSMESMKPYAQKCISSNVSVKCLNPENIPSHSFPVFKFDLKSIQQEELQNIQQSFEMKCFGCSRVHGFVTWFSVSFLGDITLSTSPYTEETHWCQTLFYVDEPFDVKQDTVISGMFKLRPNKSKNRFLDINIRYKTDSTAMKHKFYYMSDCIT